MAGTNSPPEGVISRNRLYHRLRMTFVPVLWLAGAGPLLGPLAGCGAPPTLPAVPQGARFLVAPGQPAAGPAKPEIALLGRVAAALNGVSYLEGLVSFREYGGDGRQEHGMATVHFRRSPFAARVDIEDSNRFMASGTAVLWSGGHSVRIRRKGIPLTVSFPADHSLVRSIRGYRLDQTDIFSMGKILLATGATVRILGQARVDDGERLLLEVRSPASLPGITRERIGLDPTTFIPTYREMFAGSALVHRGIGERLVLNRPATPDLFSL